MIPFKTVPFEYEGYAYGKHYAIHLADGKDGWLATCFVRFTPTDRWYRRRVTEASQVFGDADTDGMPENIEITYCDFGVAPSEARDHSSWWIAFSFLAPDFERIIEVSEDIIECARGGEILVTRIGVGAAVGSPSWEKV